MSWNFSLGSLFRPPAPSINQAVTPRREPMAAENVASQPPALTDPQATFQEPTSTSTTQVHQDASEEASTVSFGVPGGGFGAGEAVTAATIAPVRRLSQADSLDSMDTFENLNGQRQPISTTQSQQESADYNPVPGGVITDQAEELRHLFGNSGARNRALQEGFRNYSPLVQSQYSEIQQQLGTEHRAEFDTYTATLLNQQPPMSEDNVSGVLRNAQSMMQQSYDALDNAGIPPTELMLSALHDVAAPSNINQRDYLSCAATSAQMQMAIHQPAEYMDMVQTLASGESYTFENGSNYQIRPDDSPLTDLGVDTRGNPLAMRRTPSAMVVQNAFMEILDGNHNYQSQNDNSGNSADRPNIGLQRDNMPGLLTAIVGRTVPRPVDLNRAGPTARQNEAQNVLNSATPENPILVGMRWGTDSRGEHTEHAVNVIGYDSTTQRVNLMNPHGHIVSIPRAEFDARLRMAWTPQA